MKRPTDVLVVDDSDSDAEITVLAIRRVLTGATVVRLKDGDQALQFIFRTGGYSSRPAGFPGLILLELNLPLVGGLKVLDSLQSTSATAKIPVVLLSRLENALAIERGYALGASGYITKLATFDSYCAEVAEAIDRCLLKKSMPDVPQTE